MTPTKRAKLIGSAPVLFVRNIFAATEHYRDAMGFSSGKIWGEAPSFAILRRDNMSVMFKQIARSQTHNSTVDHILRALGHVFLGR